MASIRDVAKLAQVAPSTVSLVLNKKGYVSEKTKLKVQEAVKLLDYVPSEMARNLSLNRTNLIGIIVPEIAHPFFSTFIDESEQAFYQMGYKTLVCSTREKQNGEKAFVEMLRRQTMDGIIMGAHSLELSIYEGLQQPILAFDRYINDKIPIVHADHEQGGRLAAQAFLPHHCHHVVYIMGYQKVNTPANRYHETFEKVLRDAGVKVDAIEMAWNTFEPNDFDNAARELFTVYPDVDGIFGADLAVCSCLRIAFEKGLRIPEDLKLVAYDGTYITRLGAHTITSIVQPIHELALLAAKKIIAMVQGNDTVQLHDLSVTYQKGTTC